MSPDAVGVTYGSPTATRVTYVPQAVVGVAVGVTYVGAPFYVGVFACSRSHVCASGCSWSHLGAPLHICVFTCVRSHILEIRKLTNRDKCTVLPDTVGGKSGEADICHMWKEHFCKLLNSSQLVDKCDRVYDVSNTCDIFTHILKC